MILCMVMDVVFCLVEDLENYELCEMILYCGMMVLNGVLNMGFVGDWVIYNIEYVVFVVYDILYGGGFVILFLNWMKYNLDVNVDCFK